MSDDITAFSVDDLRSSMPKNGSIGASDGMVLQLTGADIEAMTARLNEAYDRAKAARDRLESGIEQRSAELASMSRYLAVVFDTVSDGLVVFDGDGVIKTANRACAEILDLSTSSMPGCNVFDLLKGFPLSDAGTSEPLESTLRLPDGRFLSAEVTVTPIEVRGESLTMARLRDLTEVLYTQKMLSEQAVLLDNSHTLVLTMNDQMRIDWCNAAFETVTGFERLAVSGRDPRVFLFEADTPGTALEEIDHACAHATSFDVEVIARHAQGRSVWLHLQGFPIVDEVDRLTRFAVLGADITERKRTDQLKVDFVSMVSHELRTPLTTINGALDTLEVMLPTDEEPVCTELVQMGQRNCTTLTRLVEDLLDISKLEAGAIRFELADFDPNSIVRDVIETLTPRALERDVTLVYEADAGVGLVRADPDRLSQVILNVVSNAIKFTPLGSQVRITSRCEGAAVSIDVADCGAGVPAEFVPQMFGRFTRDAQVQASGAEGFGLGLAICRALLDRMHGSIHYQDNPGGGALFRILLETVGTNIADTD